MAAVLLGTASPGVVAHAGATPSCFGESATIVGTRGESKVVGTAGRDVIFSRFDDQELHGLGGRDLLCGQSSMWGGRGGDRMAVRSEAAFLDSSSLYGGPGNDEIHRREALTDDPHFQLETYGGLGHDRLYGGANPDFLSGGPGRDRVFGSGLWDTVQGGAGEDRLTGGWGRDVLNGGPGDDRLFGNGLGDTLRGGDGDDVARGGPHDDHIVGNAGVDVAYGGIDVDRCVAEVEVRCEAS